MLKFNDIQLCRSRIKHNPCFTGLFNINLKALILKLLPFLSVTYTGKTCKNSPRRFDLENELTLPSLKILFCKGDCFLLFESPFWLFKGSLRRRTWCFFL